jgi:hypothetical protein
MIQWMVGSMINPGNSYRLFRHQLTRGVPAKEMGIE